MLLSDDECVAMKLIFTSILNRLLLVMLGEIKVNSMLLIILLSVKVKDW